MNNFFSFERQCSTIQSELFCVKMIIKMILPIVWGMYVHAKLFGSKINKKKTFLKVLCWGPVVVLL